MARLREGSIRKRKDGSFEGRYSVDGQRHSVYANNKAECIKKLKNAIRHKDMIKNQKTVKMNYTLNEWFDKWVRNYKAPNLKAQSLYGITSKYNKYIRDSLGKRKLQSISALDWQRLFNNIQYPTSAKKLFTHMKACYKKAMINKVIFENPMLGVEVNHKHKTKEKFVPSKDQLEKLLNYLQKKRKDLALVCDFISLTGCRVGEACALTLDDIDFEKKTITINKSFNRYLKIITEPKTAKSNREIPLIQRAEAIIKEYIELYGEKKVIFHRISSNNLTNAFKYHSRQFGLEKISLHSLRHYFSTVCREAKIDAKVVQRWIGHSSILMTLDTYTHVKDDFNQSETEKLGSYLSVI